MEDKQKICNLLLQTLQATESLRDLKSLEHDSKKEMVYATFKDGYQKIIDVGTGSGTEMLIDIIKELK